MIHSSNFQTTAEQKEILPINSVEFPYICNYTDLNTCINRCLSWHWHPLLELDYIEEGEVELRTADNTYILKKGEIIFINSTKFTPFCHPVSYNKGNKYLGWAFV